MTEVPASEESSLEGAAGAARERVANAQTVEEPFPHIVVDGLLPEQAFAELATAIPPAEYFKQGKSGTKLDLDVNDRGDEFLAAPGATQDAWRVARDQIFRDAVTPSLVERFGGTLQTKYEWLFGPEIAAEVIAGGFKSSNGRIMGRRPGYALDPHLDSAQFAVTCLWYLSSPGARTPAPSASIGPTALPR